MTQRLILAALIAWLAVRLDCRVLAQTDWKATLDAVEAIHNLTYRSGALSQRCPHAVRKIRRYVRDARKALGEGNQEATKRQQGKPQDTPSSG